MDDWCTTVCQSLSTETSFDRQHVFDADRKADYLTSLRPSAASFALTKFRLGAHTLHVKTDRWLI